MQNCLETTFGLHFTEGQQFFQIPKLFLRKLPKASGQWLLVNVPRMVQLFQFNIQQKKK